MNSTNLFFTLVNNVYLVDGYINSCLYDMNTLKLFLLNNEFRTWLKKLLSNGITTEALTKEQNIFLEQLINLNLLKKCEKPSKNNTNSILKHPPYIVK